MHIAADSHSGGFDKAAMRFYIIFSAMVSRHAGATAARRRHDETVRSVHQSCRWRPDLRGADQEVARRHGGQGCRDGGRCRRWQDDAAARQEELKKKVQGYLDDASDNVRAQWNGMQEGWDKQVAEIKARITEMRAKVDASNAEDYADWSRPMPPIWSPIPSRCRTKPAPPVAAAAEADCQGRCGEKDRLTGSERPAVPVFRGHSFRAVAAPIRPLLRSVRRGVAQFI